VLNLKLWIYPENVYRHVWVFGSQHCSECVKGLFLLNIIFWPKKIFKFLCNPFSNLKYPTQYCQIWGNVKNGVFYVQIFFNETWSICRLACKNTNTSLNLTLALMLTPIEQPNPGLQLSKIRITPNVQEKHNSHFGKACAEAYKMSFFQKLYVSISTIFSNFKNFTVNSFVFF
jgi:hypothetical protein